MLLCINQNALTLKYLMTPQFRSHLRHQSYARNNQILILLPTQAIISTHLKKNVKYLSTEFPWSLIIIWY